MDTRKGTEKGTIFESGQNKESQLRKRSFIMYTIQWVIKIIYYPEDWSSGCLWIFFGCPLIGTSLEETPKFKFN